MRKCGSFDVKIPILLFCCFLGGAAPSVRLTAQPAAPQGDERPSLAVLEFEAIGMTPSEVQEYSDFLSDQLRQAASNRIIGRPERRAMLEQMGFPEAAASTERKHQLRVGKALGVDQIILGRLSRDQQQYLLTVSIVDVSFRECLYSETRSYPTLSLLYDDAKALAREILSEAAVLRRPHWRSEIQQLVSRDNPAALGIQNRDLKIYLTQGGSWLGMDTGPGDSYTSRPRSSQSTVGVEAPVGPRLGFGCSSSFLFENTAIEASYDFDYLGTASTTFQPKGHVLAAEIGFGYRLSRRMSLGAAVGLFNRWEEQLIGSQSLSKDSFPYFGIDAGFLLEDGQERFIVEIHATYTKQRQYYLDEKQKRVVKDSCPFSLKGSVTSGRIWPLYLTLNLAADLYVGERSGHVLAAAAIVQPWSLDWRMRAGYIYTHSHLGGQLAIAHGFLVGLSVLEEDVDGIRLDVDYVLKPRHLPVAPGHFACEHCFSVGITFGIIL